jgi:hypothetical protein
MHPGPEQRLLQQFVRPGAGWRRHVLPGPGQQQFPAAHRVAARRSQRRRQARQARCSPRC